MSIFSKIQRTKVGSNTFDLSHDRKFSTKIGRLTPVFLMDCVPGDSIKIKSSVLTRFAPLIAPIMHKVTVYTHFFFVPNRILWPNWEKFITGGEDGFNNSVWPHITAYLSLNPASSLYDYLGLPTGADVGSEVVTDVSAIPFAAYQAIYNDYYRDQNLEEELDYQLVDGNNDAKTDLFDLRQRAWQHDYFTSALPWTQKGPEAMLPLGGEAELFVKRDDEDLYPLKTPMFTFDGSDSVANLNVKTSTEEPTFLWQEGIGATNPDVTGYTFADLSTATASTINELRRAVRLQEWLEKNARGGSRYIESIEVHFGVSSSDKRLQRPEFLGGLSAPIQVSEVLQMSATDEETTPQGNMSGHALGVGGGQTIGYYAEEHGYIMGIMSIMPKTAYQQGIPRHFNRRDKFDYFWPSFAHLGEQGILNRELMVTDDEEVNDEVFGYTPRYSEYKYMNSSVHGDFRTSLDFWHMGRKFATLPGLNNTFIKCTNAEIERVFAVQDNEYDNMWCHMFHDVTAKRKMPFFGTPTL